MPIAGTSGLSHPPEKRPCRMAPTVLDMVGFHIACHTEHSPAASLFCGQEKKLLDKHGLRVHCESIVTVWLCDGRSKFKTYGILASDIDSTNLRTDAHNRVLSFRRADQPQRQRWQRAPLLQKHDGQDNPGAWFQNSVYIFKVIEPPAKKLKYFDLPSSVDGLRRPSSQKSRLS
jgi:hypothetical protein